MISCGAVTVLSYNTYYQAMSEKYCHRRIQEQFGIEFLNEENSFVIFEAQLLNSSSVVSNKKQ